MHSDSRFMLLKVPTNIFRHTLSSQKSQCVEHGKLLRLIIFTDTVLSQPKWSEWHSNNCQPKLVIILNCLYFNFKLFPYFCSSPVFRLPRDFRNIAFSKLVFHYYNEIVEIWEMRNNFNHLNFNNTSTLKGQSDSTNLVA